MCDSSLLFPISNSAPGPYDAFRFNVQTGEASWVNPFGESDEEKLALPYDQSVAPYEQNKEQWVSYFDEETGQEYWYNTETGETSWNMA